MPAQLQRTFVVWTDKYRPVGSDQPHSARRPVGDAVFDVLLRRSQVGEKHVEIEPTGYAGRAETVHLDPAATRQVGSRDW
jgi:hypothetical protein